MNFCAHLSFLVMLDLHLVEGQTGNKIARVYSILVAGVEHITHQDGWINPDPSGENAYSKR
jgi:hypothetical protein